MIKSDDKDEEFIMLQNNYILDTWCSSELYTVLKETRKILYSVVLNILLIIHVFLATNNNIRMISGGSCDWSNDAKNLALTSHE